MAGCSWASSRGCFGELAIALADLLCEHMPKRGPKELLKGPRTAHGAESKPQENPNNYSRETLITTHKDTRTDGLFCFGGVLV